MCCWKQHLHNGFLISNCIEWKCKFKNVTLQCEILKYLIILDKLKRSACEFPWGGTINTDPPWLIQFNCTYFSVCELKWIPRCRFVLQCNFRLICILKALTWHRNNNTNNSSSNRSEVGWARPETVITTETCLYFVKTLTNRLIALDYSPSTRTQRERERIRESYTHRGTRLICALS